MTRKELRIRLIETRGKEKEREREKDEEEKKKGIQAERKEFAMSQGEDNEGVDHYHKKSVLSHVLILFDRTKQSPRGRSSRSRK